MAEPKPERPPTSLRRELLALSFLYGVLCVLPLLIGALFGRPKRRRQSGTGK